MAIRLGSGGKAGAVVTIRLPLWRWQQLEQAIAEWVAKADNPTEQVARYGLYKAIMDGEDW
jgi:hypothetical protein